MTIVSSSLSFTAISCIRREDSQSYSHQCPHVFVFHPIGERRAKKAKWGRNDRALHLVSLAKYVGRTIGEPRVDPRQTTGVHVEGQQQFDHTSSGVLSISLETQKLCWTPSPSLRRHFSSRQSNLSPTLSTSTRFPYTPTRSFSPSAYTSSPPASSRHGSPAWSSPTFTPACQSAARSTGTFMSSPSCRRALSTPSACTSFGLTKSERRGGTQRIGKCVCGVTTDLEDCARASPWVTSSGT